MKASAQNHVSANPAMLITTIVSVSSLALIPFAPHLAPCAYACVVSVVSVASDVEVRARARASEHARARPCARANWIAWVVGALVSATKVRLLLNPTTHPRARQGLRWAWTSACV